MKNIQLKCLLGFNVFSGCIEFCVREILDHIATGDRRCAWMACFNPHSYCQARVSNRFCSSLKMADWLVPDGVGVTIAGKILGQNFEQRITGFDIFEGVMSGLDKMKGSVFFLGSSVETLEEISRRVSRDYPSVVLAGIYSPPYSQEFSKEDVAAMLQAIEKVQPDVLWVGMTAPKQELWIAENRHRLPVVFAGAIGAVFDFYAGRVKRSHPVFRRAGLEWLPRLVREPRRLWRRTFISAPIFLFDVLVAKINKKLASSSEINS